MKLETDLTRNKLTRIATEARALVNDARRALGLRPLVEWFKGVPRHADCCPVSFALSDALTVYHDPIRIPLVDGVTVRFDNEAIARVVANAWGRAPEPGTNQVVLPFEVARFVRLFDAGNYPNLQKQSAMKEVA